MCPMSVTIAEVEVEIVCASELIGRAVTEHGEQDAAGDRGEEPAAGQHRPDDDRRGAALAARPGPVAPGTADCGAL